MRQNRLAESGWFWIVALATLCYLAFTIYQNEIKPNPANASQKHKNNSPSISADQPLVQATLLSDVNAIEPGKNFTLAVLFNIAPKWHIYWKNPGDSGLATEIELDLPPGFQAGPIRYSRHKSFTMPGDIIGYGYEHQAMLKTEVSAPAELELNQMVAIPVKASWLVCKEKCILGQVDLTLKLPVGSQVSKSNEDLFAYWQKQFPETTPPKE